MPRSRLWLSPALLVATATALLTGCSSAGGSAEPTWQESPAQVGGGEGGAGITPIVPVPQPTRSPRPESSTPAVPTSPSATPSPSRSGGDDPLVLAKQLTAPVGLTLLPDGSALVGERTTGRIVRVQPVPNRPVPTVRRLTGLDTSGDGGLLDLALSPSYTEDNLIYAYVTTKTDNRVVDFTLHGPVTTVLSGIPKGRTGNAGRLMFGDDGNLYVATGDTGHPALAQNRRSLAGKILRVDPIGDVARGNPSAGSPVFARGVSRVAGLCTSAIIGTIFGVDDSPGAPAEVNRVVAGNDYGYPNAGPTTTDPAAQLPGRYGKSGGCAVLGARLWVTSLDGQALLSAPLLLGTGSPRIGTFAVTLVKRYGRLRTVVAARDGALWLTTSNRDGFGHPISADERVIRLVPSSNSSSSPA